MPSVYECRCDVFPYDGGGRIWAAQLVAATGIIRVLKVSRVSRVLKILRVLRVLKVSRVLRVSACPLL